jgi:hypothetical protein
MGGLWQALFGKKGKNRKNLSGFGGAPLYNFFRSGKMQYIFNGVSG